MPKKVSSATRSPKPTTRTQTKDFHLELLNTAQKLAWSAFQQHDVLFLLGPAGTGKTHLSTAFAIKTLLSKECSRIVLTRPIVEAGEKLGFLPGDFEAKVNPYMMPIYDCMDRIIGREGPYRDKVLSCCEIAPLAFMRGRSFHDSVCLLDEAQNCTLPQLKMFLSRFAEGSKVIITGDPHQSDLYGQDGPCALSEVVHKLSDLTGVGIVEFKKNSIVRHPLIGSILERLGE